MAKAKKEFSVEQINAKKDLLEEKLKQSIEEKKEGRITPAQKFLNEIKELVQNALTNGIGFKQLSNDINEIYSFKISEQTIRMFAVNHLGYELRNKNVKSVAVEAKSSTKDLSIEEMKAQQKNKNKDEDTL